jgi:phage-related minor tail protein
MTANQIARLEARLDIVLEQLAVIRSDQKAFTQWKEDHSQQDKIQGRELTTLRRDLAQERLDRTRAVGKVWLEIARKVGAPAALASLIGGMGPGVFVYFKYGPEIAQILAAAHKAGGSG